MALKQSLVKTKLSKFYVLSTKKWKINTEFKLSLISYIFLQNSLVDNY